MSTRAITRITVFVLISLVLIAATTMSVRGWLGGGTTSSVSGAHVFVLGPLTDTVSQEPAAVSGGEDLLSQKMPGHHCESEARVSPDD